MSRKFFHFLNDMRKKIGREYIRTIQDSSSKPLETSSKINVALLKFLKTSICFLLVLHEYRVPYLQKPAAVAVWMALFSKRRIVFYLTKLIKHLRIWASGFTCRHCFWNSCPAPPVFLGRIRKNTLTLFGVNSFSFK